MSTWRPSSHNNAHITTESFQTGRNVCLDRKWNAVLRSPHLATKHTVPLKSDCSRRGVPPQNADWPNGTHFPQGSTSSSYPANASHVPYNYTTYASVLCMRPKCTSTQVGQPVQLPVNPSKKQYDSTQRQSVRSISKPKKTEVNRYQHSDLSQSSMQPKTQGLKTSSTIQVYEDPPTNRNCRSKTLGISGQKHGVIPFFNSENIVASTPTKKCTTKRRSTSSSSTLDRSTDSQLLCVSNMYNAPVVLNMSELMSPEKSSKSSQISTTRSPPCVKLGVVNENQRIGKVREKPKTKRPTGLKRALLNERQLRRLRRCNSAPADSRVATDVPESNGDQHFDAACASPTECVPIPNTPQILPSQSNMTKPSPLIANPEQDSLVSALLKQLSQFQDRSFVKYANAPHHRKRLKRFVCGLREVVKHLRLKHLRMIFIARDLEDGASRRCQQLQVANGAEVDSNKLSALEQILVQIWQLSLESDPITPIMLTHKRKYLAQLCNKPGRVSTIGVLSVAGAEAAAAQLLASGSAINLPHSPTSCDNAGNVEPKPEQVE